MVQKLFVAGVLSGLIVALFAFAFARHYSEPTIERAIALETATGAHYHGETQGHAHSEGETISRATQRNAGLFIGIAGYSLALSAFVAVGSCALHGRTGAGTRANVWMLITTGYVSIVLVPQLKYPASPPGVGSAETIGSRTEVYFLLLLLSVICMFVAVLTASRLRRHFSSATSIGIGLVMFFGLASAVSTMFPVISEVPRDFPQDLLLEFRVHAAALQLLIWMGLGVVFAPVASYVVDQGHAALSSPGFPNA